VTLAHESVPSIGEGTVTRLEERLRGSGRKLFVPYVTAGMPSPDGFVEVAGALGQFADAIEVGIPFSDPIMDGPVIQEASTRALAAGITVDVALELGARAAAAAGVPIVFMTYFNPVHRRGAERFAADVDAVGGAGVIVPDLPHEESGPLAGALGARGLASVQLISPTTPPERTAVLARASTGFVYAVSRLGVTGERAALDESARVVVQRIRPHTRLPVLLGIGISGGEQARSAGAIADGVIVGSAVVRKVLDGDLEGVAALARDIRSALGG
jgi:tryptophan synthase alpha chain